MRLISSTFLQLSHSKMAPQLLSSRTFKSLFDSVDTKLFDCDGVIWKGETLIDGVSQTLDLIHSKGKNVVFVTNNSVKSRRQYAEKFRSLGLSSVTQDEIFSPSFAAAMYLKVNNFPKDKKVYVIGGEGVLEELQIAGFTGLGGPILALSVKTSQTLDTSSSSAVFLSGGFSYYYLASGNNLVYLDQAKEETGPKTALNPDKWLEFKLQDTARVSHNTQLFRFSFEPSAELGLHVASCLLTRAPLGYNAEGKTKYVIRPYTPISDPEAKGYFDLLIKVYPDGKMSQHFASLKPGDVLEVKGPVEKFKYSPNMKKHIGMIAGGSGITPMLQVIDAIVKNPEDNTQISLLYANVSPDDILLKQKLDVLQANHPNLKIFYTVDNPTKNWKGGVGYVSKDMALKGLPLPADDTLILVCGPPGMMEHISGGKAPDWSQGEVKGVLKELGYTEQMVFKF